MFLQTRKLFLKKLQEVKQCSLFQKCEPRLEKMSVGSAPASGTQAVRTSIKLPLQGGTLKPMYYLLYLGLKIDATLITSKQTDESRCTCYLFFFTALLQGFHQIYVLIFISFHHNFHVLNTNQSFLYLFIYIFLPNFR